MARAPLLPRSFFRRDTPTVARALVGQLLVHDDVVVRITEVEAYCGPADTASHARHGKTARNAAIWGEPGHVYMYRCYGIHMMLNLVSGSAGLGQAVLIRSAAVVEGSDVVATRRGAERLTPTLLAGPGKVSQGLALDLDFSFHDACAAGGLELRRGDDVDVVVGARIGIDYALPRDRKALLRFALADSRAVTHQGALRRDRR